jgi:PiT family inorganic phosphate transporter
MTILLLVLLAALLFEYINGFHDAANAIATVVSTRVLTPRQAILLAAVFNLGGAFWGVGVAKTISSGLVDASAVTTTTIFAALLGAIIWNLITWWLGLPSSSSHALIGGLCGAALATAEGRWSVLHWSLEENGKAAGLWPKVVLPMFTSPIAGFIIAAFVMAILYMCLRRVTPRVVNMIFGKAQILSAASMGFSHGSNDAQKTMGIMTLALVAGTQTGIFDELPGWMGFLHHDSTDIPRWIVVVCALTMAAGTAAGGWRIIRTMGHKMVKLQPVHGFAAETSAALVILTASHLKIPLSTTHVISSCIMGVGSIKRFSAVKWGVVGRIVWAWVLTIPITGLLGYGIDKLLRALGAP